MEKENNFFNEIPCRTTSYAITCPCDPADLSSSVSEEIPKIKHEKQTTSTISIPKFDKQSTEGEVSVIYNDIVNVFERALSKLELTATLPFLLINMELAQILTKDELQIVNDAFMEKLNESNKAETAQANKTNVMESTSKSKQDAATSPLSSSSLSESDSESKSTSSAIDLRDWRTFEAIEILNSYPRVRTLAKTFERIISPSTIQFLEYIRYMIDYVLSLMKSTPEEARARELYYRRMWREQKKFRKDLQRCSIVLENNRDKFKSMMEKIVTQYTKDTVMIEGINKKCVESLEHLSTKFEKTQYAICKLSQQKQNELQIQVTNAREELEALRKLNLSTEQQIRTNRYKVQSKLQSILNKFDAEIGDRQQLYDELVDTYEKDKMEKERLEAFINAVEFLYYAGEEEEGDDDEEWDIQF